MKDTLALALVRAEICRAHAAERSRPEDRAGNRGDDGVLVRVWRSIRAPRRSPVVPVRRPSD